MVAPSEFLAISRYAQFLICGVLAASSAVTGERTAVIQFAVAAVAVLLSRFARPRLTSSISAGCLVFGLLPIISDGTAGPSLWTAIPFCASGVLFASLIHLPVEEPPRRSAARRARYSRIVRRIRS